MYLSSGMTLATAIASGWAMQPLHGEPSLLSAALPSIGVLGEQAIEAPKLSKPETISREVDLAVRSALFKSTKLVALL